MPRKLKLSYKKHGVKAKNKGACVTTAAADDDIDDGIDNVASSKVAHSSTQTEKTSFESSTTQTEVVTKCDMALQTGTQLSTDEHLLTPLQYSFVVRVNLDIFYSLKLTDINQLQQKLTHMKSINIDWFLVPGKLQPDRLQIVKLGHPYCMFTLEILSDMKWLIQLPNGSLSQENSPVLENLPKKIATLKDLAFILSFLDDCTLCKGNSDSKFAPIVAQHKGIFKDRTGKL